MIRSITKRLLLGSFVLVGIWWAWPRSPASGEPLAHTQAAAIPLQGETKAAKFFGTATCSSMACHHKNDLKGSEGSEYSTWAGHDRHANAFLVLYNERSTRIFKNMPELKTISGGHASKATDAALCLKCHSTGDGEKVAAGPRFTKVDGVGCEACHGPSEHYLARHYKPAFQALSPTDKATQFGLWPTKDLAFRAKLCSSCHVGDGSKEVNHDLIAAGHPRLSFEMGSYLGIYHKHWQVANERQRFPDLQAREWAIGQVGTARAAIDLLRVRAERAQNPEAETPWPEFSEHECFACHQDLEIKSAELLKEKYAHRRPGSMPWQIWYTASLEKFANADGVDLSSLNKLRELMETSAPDAEAVAQQSKKTLATLDNWLLRLNSRKVMTASEMRHYAHSILANSESRGDVMSWDEATQTYLSVAALSHGLRDLGDPQLNRLELESALKPLRKKLQSAFPKGYDSPRNFNPVASPKLSDLFGNLRTQFGN